MGLQIAIGDAEPHFYRFGFVATIINMNISMSFPLLHFGQSVMSLPYFSGMQMLVLPALPLELTAAACLVEITIQIKFE